jgi:hypothetical protein
VRSSDDDPARAEREANHRLVEHLAAGRLSTDVEEPPLAQAEESWRCRQRGPGRKLVIVPVDIPGPDAQV